jgi:hypothetical protein
VFARKNFEIAAWLDKKFPKKARALRSFFAVSIAKYRH